MEARGGYGPGEPLHKHGCPWRSAEDGEAERRTSLQTGLPSKTRKVGSAALRSAVSSFTPAAPSHPHAPALR